MATTKSCGTVLAQTNPDAVTTWCFPHLHCLPRGGPPLAWSFLPCSSLDDVPDIETYSDSTSNRWMCSYGKHLNTSDKVKAGLPAPLPIVSLSPAATTVISVVGPCLISCLPTKHSVLWAHVQQLACPRLILECLQGPQTRRDTWTTSLQICSMGVGRLALVFWKLPEQDYKDCDMPWNLNLELVSLWLYIWYHLDMIWVLKSVLL